MALDSPLSKTDLRKTSKMGHNHRRIYIISYYPPVPTHTVASLLEFVISGHYTTVTPDHPMAQERARRALWLPSPLLHTTIHYVLFTLNNPSCHPFSSLSPWPSYGLLLKPLSIWPCRTLWLTTHLYTVPLKMSLYYPRDTSCLFTHLCICTSCSLCLELLGPCPISSFSSVLQEGVKCLFKCHLFRGPHPKQNQSLPSLCSH